MREHGGKKSAKKKPFAWVFIGTYGVFVSMSLILGFQVGFKTGENFLIFGREMIFILPAAFVLIGLFEVWVPRTTVDRHLGSESGPAAYLWSILLAGTTVGGLFVAFPVAWALHRKGARLGVIFAYVGLSGVCRVPMTLFEVSFMGIEFTLIRYLVAVPLVILLSDRLGKYLEKRDFSITSPDGSESPHQID